MSKSEYLVAIADAETATQLHALGEQARTDGELFAGQRLELARAISDKFCALNAATNPNRKPRW